MILKLIIVNLALTLSFFNALTQNICFINTKQISRAKGVDINFPYLCNSPRAKNSSPDCVLSFNVGDSLISEWLIVQIGQPIKDFDNIDNKNAIKASFSSQTDKVVSVKKTSLGKISAWEIILDKYSNSTDSLYDRCVDYIFLKGNYYISIVFTCTGLVVTKKSIVEKFNANYKLFKLVASKVVIN